MQLYKPDPICNPICKSGGSAWQAEIANILIADVVGYSRLMGEDEAVEIGIEFA